jgi:N-methylhydantoinase A
MRTDGAGAVEVPVFAWAELPVGWTHPGPAVVEQDLATLFVPPGYAAAIGPYGDLDMRRA